MRKGKEFLQILLMAKMMIRMNYLNLQVKMIVMILKRQKNKLIRKMTHLQMIKMNRLHQTIAMKILMQFNQIHPVKKNQKKLKRVIRILLMLKCT